MIGITIVQFSWILQELQKKTASSLWNYYRDEASNPLSCNSESFKYMRNITGNTYDGNYNPDKAAKNETEVFILLKHFSNFCRSLNILLTNSKIDLILTLSKKTVFWLIWQRELQEIITIQKQLNVLVVTLPKKKITRNF